MARGEAWITKAFYNSFLAQQQHSKDTPHMELDVIQKLANNKTMKKTQAQDFVGWSYDERCYLVAVVSEKPGWFKMIHPSKVNGMNCYSPVGNEYKETWGRNLEEAKAFYKDYYSEECPELKLTYKG